MGVFSAGTKEEDPYSAAIWRKNKQKGDVYTVSVAHLRVVGACGDETKHLWTFIQAL